MVNVLVSEKRNVDPVRFYQNKIRVFLGLDYQYGVWVDEDRLFSFLDDNQKRTYLLGKRGVPLELELSAPTVRRLVETGYTMKGRKEVLEMLSELN